MRQVTIHDVESALALLAELGAPPHLIKHHALVAEAADALVSGLGNYAEAFDGGEVLVGAALHDAGKIVHPGEMSGPGHHHERAGQKLLAERGLVELARFCVSHADWDRDDRPLEDLLVALADKLWKGKRVQELERRVVNRLASTVGADFWDVFMTADSVFERVAADGDARLASW